MRPDKQGCTREADVLEAIATGRWPEYADAELSAHVQGCETCAEVAGIASMLQSDHQALASQAVVPSSGIVWWKAQMRARAEAARQASRPLTIAQIAGVLCGIGLVLALVVFSAPIFAGWFGGLGHSLASLFSGATFDPSPFGWIWPLAIAVCVALTTTIVYFGLRDDAKTEHR